MSDPHSSHSPSPCRCGCCADHHRRIDDLLAELDAERAAAASAAAESMEMIRRLQREKSEAMLESRQFRRFAEEQMARYRYEIEALEEVLAEKEHAISSLSNEIEDCKRMFDDLPRWMNYTLDDATVMEKQVVKQSPNTPNNKIRHLSSSSSGSRLDFDSYEYDDMIDHPCTIDTVPISASVIPNNGVEEEEIRKLCERVKVLEKDRDSVRQVMDDMEVERGKGGDVVKEIKLKLYEEVVPQRKTVVKRGAFFKRFSIFPYLKCSFRWIKSKIFARKKPLRIRYTFGQTARNVGLLVLLHMLPAPRPRKNICLREPKSV